MSPPSVPELPSMLLGVGLCLSGFEIVDFKFYREDTEFL